MTGKPIGILTNNTMIGGKAMARAPADLPGQIIADSNTLFATETLLELTAQPNRTFGLPEEVIAALIEAAKKSDRPVTETVGDFVQQKRVIEHIKANGYDIAQVTIGLGAIIQQALG